MTDEGSRVIGTELSAQSDLERPTWFRESRSVDQRGPALDPELLTMSAERLAIRADAETRMGAGHVMRCLALAQAWRASGGEATFLTAADAPGLLSRLRSEGMAVRSLIVPPGGADDAEQTIALSREIGSEWVVVDGYHFDLAYHQALKRSGLRLLALDDNGHAERPVADVILNQNIHAGPHLYPALGLETRLLLGTRHALLRQEFLEWSGWERRIPSTARRVLVTLGGGDAENVTLRVIEALAGLDVSDLAVKVVCGQVNRHRDSWERAARSASFSLEIVSAAREMPALMAWADLAVTGGGSTCWELAFMGLPALSIVLADNQRGIVERLDDLGVVTKLGEAGRISRDDAARAVRAILIDSGRRQEMSLRGRALVDGQGAARVVEHLRGKNAQSAARA